MKNKSKVLVNVIFIISLLGLITSLYLVNEHYATDSSACDFSETVSCSLVNSSIFSEILNVPVAIMGAIWFIFLALIAWNSLKSKDYVWLLLAWNLLGLLSVVYLVIAEIILKALCPFCTVVHVLVLISLVLSYLMYKNAKKPEINLKKLKNFIALVILINLIPLVAFNIDFSKEDHTEVAKCITEKGVNMYGSFRCGVCAKTRTMFGEAFEHINEIECHPQGENAQTELCLEKGIDKTPTWILEPNGVEKDRRIGFMSVNELAVFAGCIQ
jgi:uncharacterized membrane protein